MIKVVNKRSGEPGVYIGRPSLLGNPFVIGKHGNREEVVEKYKEFFYDQLGKSRPFADEIDRITNIYRTTGALTLICWCAPELCHGDVIRDYILMVA